MFLIVLWDFQGLVSIDIHCLHFLCLPSAPVFAHCVVVKSWVFAEIAL